MSSPSPLYVRLTSHTQRSSTHNQLGYFLTKKDDTEHHHESLADAVIDPPHDQFDRTGDETKFELPNAGEKKESSGEEESSSVRLCL